MVPKGNVPSQVQEAEGLSLRKDSVPQYVSQSVRLFHKIVFLSQRTAYIGVISNF